ncbi:hypothetical protein FACS18947_0830 [Bacteroidia bacterium]|nr:hypothetical protein FACS18947_0830 [Bacteroidia bacterium]
MRRYENERDPIDHMVDLVAMREMEEILPMTLYERKSLHSWVYKGNDPEKNPWGYCDEDGWPLNYLKAYRHHHGYTYLIRYKIIEE